LSRHILVVDGVPLCPYCRDTLVAKTKTTRHRAPLTYHPDDYWVADEGSIGEVEVVKIHCVGCTWEITGRDIHTFPVKEEKHG